MDVQKRKAWYIANTTIRNPLRLKDGLRCLVDSPLHGNLEGRMREQQFAALLNNAGIVDVKRLRRTSAEDSIDVYRLDLDARDASDVGRKWRAALMQMGFITAVTSVSRQYSKQPYTLTPNGERLLASTTLPEEQEAFLRALLAHQLPSQVDKYIDVPPFSPLRVVLGVIAGLEDAGLDGSLTQVEMAFIVQLVTKMEDVRKAVQEIALFREEKRRAIEPKIFERIYRQRVASTVKEQNEDTIYTYADANFKYLKLTGLFANGRRLRFAEYKRTIIKQILSTPFIPLTPDKYLETLWNGTGLPTDHKQQAIEAIKSTETILRERAGTETIEGLEQLELFADLNQVQEADLSRLRLKLEDDLLKLFEADFAKKQRAAWEEIVKYLKGVIHPHPSLIPKNEMPAYFEWILWRAFLAINSLVNKPWEARRFRVDQEMKPINPAPGGGPDMIFEFNHFVVAVEVTLTTSSRQEAVEGEPVRRHIANLVDKYAPQGKQVYGLFVALKIDTNTAETFRGGSWYRPDDTHQELRIIPVTLQQFTNLFETAFHKTAGLDYLTVEEIITHCLNVKKDVDAPQWKKRIEEYVVSKIQQMQGTGNTQPSMTLF